MNTVMCRKLFISECWCVWSCFSLLTWLLTMLVVVKINFLLVCDRLFPFIYSEIVAVSKHKQWTCQLFHLNFLVNLIFLVRQGSVSQVLSWLVPWLVYIHWGEILNSVFLLKNHRTFIGASQRVLMERTSLFFPMRVLSRADFCFRQNWICWKAERIVNILTIFRIIRNDFGFRLLIIHWITGIYSAIVIFTSNAMFPC